MQEIKFRAWNKGNNEWLKGRDLCIYLDGSISIFGNPPCPINIFPKYYPMITIVQFTGLYDKNGKEIYEGDIVQCGKSIAVVERNDAIDQDFYWGNATGFVFNFDPDLMGDDQQKEIIGNIYENPELIKA